jgi:Ulp1 family protease catalytic subunit
MFITQRLPKLHTLLSKDWLCKPFSAREARLLKAQYEVLEKKVPTRNAKVELLDGYFSFTHGMLPALRVEFTEAYQEQMTAKADGKAKRARKSGSGSYVTAPDMSFWASIGVVDAVLTAMLDRPSPNAWPFQVREDTIILSCTSVHDNIFTFGETATGEVQRCELLSYNDIDKWVRACLMKQSGNPILARLGGGRRRHVEKQFRHARLLARDVYGALNKFTGCPVLTDSATQILVPVWADNHFVVIRYFPYSGKVYVFDSLYSTKTTGTTVYERRSLFAVRVLHVLLQLATAPLSVERHESLPRPGIVERVPCIGQSNSADCGFYALLYIRLLGFKSANEIHPLAWCVDRAKYNLDDLRSMESTRFIPDREDHRLTLEDHHLVA